MRIDEVSQKLNIAKSQIRYYEKIGLLRIPRDTNQYRYFDDTTMIELKLIMDLKALDIELKDMKYIIELFHKPTTKRCNTDSVEYINKVIQEKEDELNNQILILNKLKKIHELSKNNQYQLNKEIILKELNQRREHND
ncbi:MerR family transcriptional regulator [Staphylococcus aureus]|uniref:MerR family transcriptional regulator n=1 Tax=Staphylococcus aureus TaxID=1280 RepID=UPI000E003AF0|nr:MerR family transcriptional regulator [Staphylococcus aureus]SUK19906.1 transcriptional regulator, MarR family protein [Staphylococcus aureus]SUK93485.1 transcriptional regulator, MarR family protein [Staphylococcus aureus]SUL05069.1 transcriptional regulator, MarR family protein [Staphylococcus aureus]SUL06827.1 transcriptional regulator, MarR family protein [Staphylococcus aureus]SUL82963.1 transcriptional regulator, MarR family protein [Staphylococcus aureus]